MEVKFTGSLSEIKAEMSEFLGEALAKSGKVDKKTTKAPEKVTSDTIREAMLACDNKDGKKALLADYGASKISELDEDKFEDFLAELKKL